MCDPDTASKSTTLHAFLLDEANRETLSRPWEPFPKPSAHEKNKFESKTAPISVTPASGSNYSLDEIKADALWLSQLAQISEYVALRLAVVEWQSRPTVQLLSGLTEEEALSVDEAAGLSHLGASTFVPNSSIVTAPSGLADTQFDSAEQRKLRLIQIYQATCVAILRISQLLISWGGPKDDRHVSGQEYRVFEGWLEKLGQDIATRQNQNQKSDGLSQCIRAVNDRCISLENGFTWNVPSSIQEAVGLSWMTTQVTELVHILHIALVHADLFTQNFAPAATIEQWFTTAAEKDFFQSLVLVSKRISLEKNTCADIVP